MCYFSVKSTNGDDDSEAKNELDSDLVLDELNIDDFLAAPLSPNKRRNKSTKGIVSASCQNMLCTRVLLFVCKQHFCVLF